MFQGDLSALKDAFCDLFFPPSCAFCGRATMDGTFLRGICETCSESILPIEPPICQRCGLSFPGLNDRAAEICGHCLADPPPYERARFGVRYDGELRRALVRFKYYRMLSLSGVLGGILIEAFHRHFTPGQFDLIIPIPISKRRLLIRGFNQSAILARLLSAHTGISADLTRLRKVKETLPQVGLPRSERVANIRNSFGVSRPRRIQGRRVLLVDDVATTGATIAEAARTLQRAKAASVDALVLAFRVTSSAQSLANSADEATADDAPDTRFARQP
ncbi:MAG: ComF family protein [Deltaproteobacteria bacterium]|nr:ComF family protein [Deltaproteobacteria bacterium]